MRTTLLAACAGLLALVSGCDAFGDEEGSAFEWAQPGNTFVYDFQPGNDSLAFRDGRPIPATADAATLTVEEEGAPHDLSLFWDTAVGGDLSNFSRFHYPLGGNLVKREDGLYRLDYRDCPGLILYFTWLRVPARPNQGSHIPFFTCGRQQIGGATVVAKERINVPAGEFEVFVLEAESERWREYWNAQVGLIRADTYGESGALEGSLVLSERDE